MGIAAVIIDLKQLRRVAHRMHQLRGGADAADVSALNVIPCVDPTSG